LPRLAVSCFLLLSFVSQVAPSNEKGASKYGIQSSVLDTYIRSCAGYCVITYLLGVGDRHLDNIMLLPAGNFFHIDFGYIFGRDPKPLPPPFRLTSEMVAGMGGSDSEGYRQFKSLCCQAFNILRKHTGLILNLLHLMGDAGINDLSNNPSSDAEGVIAKVEEKFRLELSDEQAETYFVGMIYDSVSALAPRVMEVFHQIAVSRR
jgi:phosphatidylinositol 3-kinase